MHVGGAVARAAEAIAEAEIGALALGDELGERLDGLDRTAGDLRRPFGRTRAHMLLELARRVGVFFEILAVRKAIAEQAVHHRAGERAVGAGAHQHGEVGRLHRAVLVDVDRHDLGAALLSRAHRVGHHVDLRVDRIGAPDHHEVGARHLARIGPGELAGAGDEAGPGRIDADRRVKAGVLLHMAQAVDAVAHDEAHRAGVVVGPDRLAAVFRFRREEFLRDEVERVIPRDRRELARSLRPLADERMQQPVRMMDALGVARDLRADHARRVEIVLGAAHAADRAAVEHLHFERAGGRAIVRTG